MLLPLAAGSSGNERLVLQLFIELMVILAVTRAVVVLLRRLGQTDVAGELLAGFLLGPSFLGAIAPGLATALFPPETTGALVVLGQIGLVLLMFEIGLRFELGSAFRVGKKVVALVSLASILIPLGAGLLAGPGLYSWLPEPRPPEQGFVWFLAIALSITAIPMLGRIFMELELAGTRAAAIIIGSAAINDVASWLLLGGLALSLGGNVEPSWVLLRLLGLAGFVFGVLVVLRPFLKRALHRHVEAEGSISSGAITIVIILVLASAALAKTVGVVAVLGAMLLGISLHDERRFVEAWELRVAPFVRALLLPVFFTNTGLRVDLGLLGSSPMLLLALAVILLGFSTKLAGVFLAARVAGEAQRTAGAMAIGMNTRGMMAFVALDVGHELGLATGAMFTSLALMALLSDFLPTPLLKRWMPKS